VACFEHAWRQLLQVTPDRSMRHKRPACSGQVSAASIPEIKSEPAYSAALLLMFRGVIIVTFALLAALLGIAVVAALHDTAVRAFAQWTLLGFLFVYCVLSRHAVEQN